MNSDQEQSERVVGGEVLNWAQIDQQVIEIIARLKTKNFKSKLRSNWTVAMDLDHIFGCHFPFGPTTKDITVADKKLWLDKILSALPALQPCELNDPVFFDMPTTTPAAIIHRLNEMRLKLK
jgi:hypothetical protein